MQPPAGKPCRAPPLTLQLGAIPFPPPAPTAVAPSPWQCDLLLLRPDATPAGRRPSWRVSLPQQQRLGCPFWGVWGKKNPAPPSPPRRRRQSLPRPELNSAPTARAFGEAAAVLAGEAEGLAKQPRHSTPGAWAWPQRLIDNRPALPASLHDAWQTDLSSAAAKPCGRCCSATQWTPVAGRPCHRPAAQPGSCGAFGRLPTA